MRMIHRPGWHLPDRLATPEALVFDRRSLLVGAAASALAPALARAQRAADAPDPAADLYPAKRNETYALDRPVTDETINGHYNNFYEFGMDKGVADRAQALTTRPW